MNILRVNVLTSGVPLLGSTFSGDWLGRVHSTGITDGLAPLFLMFMAQVSHVRACLNTVLFIYCTICWT